jgi:hypothetical protein
MNLKQVKDLLEKPHELHKQLVKENHLPPLCPPGGTFTFEEPTDRWERLKAGKLYVINIENTLIFYEVK